LAAVLRLALGVLGLDLPSADDVARERVARRGVDSGYGVTCHRRPPPTGSPGAPLPLRRALDARGRRRKGFEACDGDELAAGLAPTVVAALDARERAVDRLDLRLPTLIEPREETADVLLLRLLFELGLELLIQAAKIPGDVLDLVEQRAPTLAEE